MVELASDSECGTTLARVLTAIVAGDVPQKTADILSSATLIVLPPAMEALKQHQGEAYRQPQRPIGMGTSLVKAACSCALTMVKDAMGPADGPSHFAVETKGGCALLQWALQMAMEVNPVLAGANLDASNAFGEIKRDCTEAAIRADPYLHRLLPLFELLYKRGEGVLWYYDEHGRFVLGVKNMRGVRQGCVLGMFLFCVTVRPIYARLRDEVGEEGALYTYCDDSYLFAPAEQMTTVLRKAPEIFGKVGLRIGYGPSKTKLILPRGCSRQDFPFPLDDPQVPAPHVVAGFKSCLGVPMHFENDPIFPHEALKAMNSTHDRLLDLT